MKMLELLWDDKSTMFFTDGINNYGLNYWDIPKEELREYVDPELVVCVSELSPDGDGQVDHYYDDDSWVVDGTIVMNYIEDYMKTQPVIVEYSDGISDGEIFIVVEGDNGYHESLMEQFGRC